VVTPSIFCGGGYRLELYPDGETLACGQRDLTGSVIGVLLATSRGIRSLRRLSAMPLPSIPPKNHGSSFSSMKGHHVALRVPDFEASKQWFVEKLDFRVLFELTSGDLHFAYLAPATDDTFFIEIIGGDSPVPRPSYSELRASMREAGYHHFCMNVDNIEETITELRRRGVTIIREPIEREDIKRKFAFFADPWGNAIELSQVIA
jgi:glyoxylase I family protein